MANEQDEPSGKDHDSARLPKDELHDQEAELREEIDRLKKKIGSEDRSALDDDEWTLPDLDDDEDDDRAVSLRPRPSGGNLRAFEEQPVEAAPEKPVAEPSAHSTADVVIRPVYKEAGSAELTPGQGPGKPPKVPEAPQNPEMELMKIVGRRLFLTVFIVGIIFVVWIALRDAEPRNNVTSTESTSEDGVEDGTTADDVLEVVNVLEAFSLAQTLEEKAQYVLDPDQNLPIMEAYYEDHPLPGKAVKDDIKVVFNRGSHMHAGVPRNYLVGSVRDEFEKESDYILTKRAEEWKIDWKGSVGYNEASVQDLANARETTEGVLRVLAATSDYYNFGYTSEEYASFLMRTIDPEEPGFHAFIKRDNELYERLKNFVTKNQRRAVTMRFRFPAGTDDGIAEIATLEKMSWLD